MAIKKLKIIKKVLKWFPSKGIDCGYIDFIKYNKFSENIEPISSGTDLFFYYNTKTNEINGFEYLNMKRWVKEKKIKISNIISKIIEFKEPIKVIVNEDSEFKILGYDSLKKAVYFSFGNKQEVGIGFNLGKNIIINLNPNTKELLGVAIFNLSELIQKHEGS